jgi:hypothetical protein
VSNGTAGKRALQSERRPLYVSGKPALGYETIRAAMDAWKADRVEPVLARVRMLVAVGISGVTLSVVLLGVPAAASFDHHFSVAANKTRVRNSPEAKYWVKAVLVDAPTRNRRVGRLWAVCRFIYTGEKCRFHFHFNGRGGGFGNVGAKGKLSPHDRSVQVHSGTHNFKGVGGKVVLSRTTKEINFDLTR